MKCKKFDEKWFENKLKQYMNMPTSPEKRFQRLMSLANLADTNKINLDAMLKRMYPQKYKKVEVK